MARDLLLRPRWLVWLVVAWGLAVASAPRLVEAAPLPPARGGGGSGDLDVARTLLERTLVQARLAELGVSESEAAELWARLTPAERTELAERAQELRAGGDPIAAVVAIAIIVAMVVILTLELLGRRIISRPSEPEGAKP
ncbi:MAG TPA: PA2779 family protein [Methylomirabilota bacterium]|jgi:hypothetical protein